MRISDWSSDVCSSDLLCLAVLAIEGVASELPTANWDNLIERAVERLAGAQPVLRVVVAPNEIRWNRLRANLYKFHGCARAAQLNAARFRGLMVARQRSEEHTSELQSLMRISYAV